MITRSEQGQITYQESAARVADAVERGSPTIGPRLRHAIFRLAREYTEARGHVPTPAELGQEVKERYDPRTRRLRFDFNPNADPLGYPAIFANLTKGHPQQKSMLDYLVGHHDKTLQLTPVSTLYLTTYKTEADLLKHVRELLQYGLIANLEGFFDELDRTPDDPLTIGRNKVMLLLDSYAGFTGQYAITELIRSRMPDFIRAVAERSVHYASPDYETYKDIRKANPKLSARQVTGLELIFNGKLPDAFNLSVYLQNRAQLAYEYHDIRQLNVMAAMTALLMPEQDALMKYLRQWGPRLKNPAGHPMSQCLKHLTVQAYDPSICYEAWGEGMKRYGPRFAFYCAYARHLPVPPCDKLGQPSLQKTRDALMPVAYKDAKSDPELAEFCFRRAIPEKDFNTAAELFRRYHEPDSEPDNIPDYKFSGEKFGLPGTTFHRLAYNDPRLLFIGTFTGCCEHIGSACDETITHAVSTRLSTFYAITDNKTGNILAHSWVWVSPNDYLVFDGFETARADIITSTVVTSAIQYFAGAIEQERLVTGGFKHLRAVALGKCGSNVATQHTLPQIDMGEIIPLTPSRDLAPEDRALINKKHKVHMGDSSEFRYIKSFEPPRPPLLLKNLVLGTG